MTSNADCLCPGIFTVFCGGTATNGDPSGEITWEFIRHVDQWAIDPNRQEAPRKQTSSTCRKAIKFCRDQLQWSVNVTNTLCEIDDQWLYCHILENPRDPSVGACKWWFLGFDPIYLKPECTGNAQVFPGQTDGDALINNVGNGHTEKGIYLFGQVSPPGFGGQNDGQDVSTAEWAIDVINGPYFPLCTDNGLPTPPAPADLRTPAPKPQPLTP